VDTACFSPLRPPDRTKPIAWENGCQCDSSDQEYYCQRSGLLGCSGGKWRVAADGPCWIGNDPVPKTCEQQGWFPRDSSGYCPRGYGSVAPDIGPDGGIATPGCCDDIEISRQSCLSGGFHTEPVASSDPANLIWLCHDGSQVHAFIRDSVPIEGCCEGAP
jgi:hypothetical protein